MQKINKKSNIFIRLLIVVFALLILVFAGCENADANAKSDASIEIHVLDVGQGECILIESEGHYLLYDGGVPERSSYVVSYLKKHGIEKFDFIVASHYDADHISGLIGVLNVFSCDTVLLPDYIADTSTFTSFDKMLTKNGAKRVYPKQGETYCLGSCRIEIVGPFSYSYTEENDRSICIRVECGSKHFLLCGDAGKQAEADMRKTAGDLQSDVYFVNHHGSGYSSDSAFLNVVSPTYAVICCGLDNEYGHPADVTLERLKKAGCKLYRTDIQGEIGIRSDGKSITFDKEPTDNWESGAELSSGKDEVPVAADNVEAKYVCNTNTKRFHYPSCSSVAQMKEKNRVYTDKTREELISEGYRSCGNCRP